MSTRGRPRDEGAAQIEPKALAAALSGETAPCLVDVRSRAECDLGMLPGANVLPLAELCERIEAVAPDRAACVVLYCASGQRSARGVALLHDLGYRDARSLCGGLDAWRAAGLPLSMPAGGGDALSAAQLERYDRQLRLPEIGVAGQRRLGAARVLCVGAGGLGSPALLYLAAAGVGRISIVDDDVVQLGNLHRQIVHATERVGTPKVASAASTLRALNPDVEIAALRQRLDVATAAPLVGAHDLVIDASDNFATRYLLNDAALAAGRPLVSAAIQGFEGQVGVFDGTPCYRCLFPEPPPAGFAPSCDEAGVLGVLPGLLGVLQATEALKLLLGIGESLRGRLLVIDALTMRFSELRIAPDPACRCQKV